MASIVQHDASNSAKGTSVSSLSVSLTISGSNSNRYLVAGVSIKHNTTAPTITSVNWNTSEALSSIISGSPSFDATIRSALYGLANPTATTEDVDLVLSGTADEIYLSASAFYNVNQQTPIQKAGFRDEFDDSGNDNPTPYFIACPGVYEGMAVALMHGQADSTGTRALELTPAISRYDSVSAVTASAGVQTLSGNLGDVDTAFGTVQLVIATSENNADHTCVTPGYIKGGQTNHSGGSFTVSWWWKITLDGAIGSQDISPAIRWSGSNDASTSVHVFNNVKLSIAPILAIGTPGQGTGTTHTSTGGNTTRDGSMVVYVDVCGANTAVDQPAGWTEFFDAGSATGPIRHALGSKTVTTAGTGSGDISVTGGNAAWIQFQIELLRQDVAAVQATKQDSSSSLTSYITAYRESDEYNSFCFLFNPSTNIDLWNAVAVTLNPINKHIWHAPQSRTDGTDTNSYNFASVPIGTAADDRTVFAFFNARSSSTLKQVNAVTIGGVSATCLANVQANTGATTWSDLSIWAATVPSGTTATFSVTISAANALRLLMFSAVNYGVSPSIHDSVISEVSSNASVAGSFYESIDVQQGGTIFGLGGWANSNASNGIPCFITEYVDTSVESSLILGAVLDNAKTTETRPLHYATTGTVDSYGILAVSLYPQRVANSTVTLDNVAISSDATAGGTAAALNITLDNVAISSAATVLITATLTKTLDTIAISSTGTVDTLLTVEQTLEDVDSNSTATVETSLTLNKTLDNVAISATGIIEIIATLTKTLDNVTISSTGKNENHATATITLANVTGSSTIDVQTLVTVNQTLANVAPTIETTNETHGTLTKTLDNIAISATLLVDKRGELEVTLANVTILSDGSVEKQLTLEQTLANVAISSTAQAIVSGTLAVTLDNRTVTSEGTVETLLTVNQTLTNVQISSAGTNENHGSLERTLANVTSTSAGTVATQLTLTQTLADVSLTSAVTCESKFSLTKTLDNVAISATGAVEIQGFLTRTLANVTINSTGTNETHGTLTRTTANVTSTSAGRVETHGSFEVTTGDVTLTGIATIPAIGTLTKTLDNSTVTSTVTVESRFTLNKTLDNVTSTSDGTVLILANADITLDDMLVFAGDKIISIAGLNRILASVTGESTGEVDISASASINIANVVSTISGYHRQSPAPETIHAKIKRREHSIPAQLT